MKEHREIRVIIAGGGTGGHIFPAIAIANALKKLQPSCTILFVGAKGKMEMEKVPKAGYEIVGLDIAGFNRSNLWKNISLPFKLWKSFMQAKKVIRQFKPTVAVGVGGYASFPILFMAQQNRIATIIQEQNSYAGKSNKVLGKKAKAICVAYDQMEKFFPEHAIIKTGNPVRASISQNVITQQEAKKSFSFSATDPVVFVFGGSLGAKSINAAMMLHVQQLVDVGLQVIWQTGVTYYEQALASVKGIDNKVKVFEFIQDMDIAYAAADIIVSRSGASSIAELCIVAKPVIFVPYPFASEDHQTHNAMALVKHNAAMLIKDQDVAVELIPKTIQLFKNELQRNIMQQNLKQLATEDADIQIANTILKLSA
jgi:UDP-N-acetylglucosamine--N-acetylmuramyl-(pentapeptide) pyrophosphoryl-undecaprenol N-acetylglucosamine transferase